tara:strand:- start:2725 stop:3549 length:825 start_codon:yes stop_codon:yes gene_type:complete
MIDYREKYLKYKKKYLNLNLNGGKKKQKTKNKKQQKKTTHLSNYETPHELLKNKLQKLTLQLQEFSEEDINKILSRVHIEVIEEISVENLQDKLEKELEFQKNLAVELPDFSKGEISVEKKNIITTNMIINIFNSQPPQCISVKTDLEKRITKFIFNRGDMCCIDETPKSKVIKAIFKEYKKTFESEEHSYEYLNWIYNDISSLIPTTLCHYNLKNEKVDQEGLKIKKYIDEILNIGINDKDETVLINKLTNVLKQLPLFYLLGLLGFHITTNM